MSGTLKRIAIGGAVFALAIPVAFLISQVFYHAEVHIPNDMDLANIGLMAIGAIGVFWLSGCLVAAIVIAIIKVAASAERSWAVPVLTGTLVTLTPWFALMLKNQTIFFAQDHLILGIAGVSTGMAVAATEGRFKGVMAHDA